MVSAGDPRTRRTAGEVGRMPQRWPADTEFREIELDVLDRDCKHCGKMMHVCDHRHRRLHTFDGPLRGTRSRVGEERGGGAAARVGVEGGDQPAVDGTLLQSAGFGDGQHPFEEAAARGALRAEG